MPAPRLFACSCAVAFAAFVASGCGGSSIPDDAICRVGEATVSKPRFDQAYDAASGQSKARTGDRPSGREAAALKRQVAAQLVTAAAWRSLARERDLKVDDSDVERAERELVKTGFGGDRKRYVAQLEVEGRSLRQARADLRDQLYLEVVRDDVQRGTKVSERDARDWLEEHPADFGGEPESREVQHVLIRPGGKAGAKDDAAAEAFAERTRRELDGASEREFGAVARRFSDDPSFGPTGGSFTYQRGTIDPAFEDVAFALGVDEVSKPVKTRLGWHVVVARGEAKEATIPTFSKVEKQVREAAGRAKRDEALAEVQQDAERLVEKASCRAAYRSRPDDDAPGTSSNPAPATKTQPADDPEPETATP